MCSNELKKLMQTDAKIENSNSLSKVECVVCLTTHDSSTSHGIFCSHRNNSSPKFICYSCIANNVKYGSGCYICTDKKCREKITSVLEQNLPNEEIKFFKIRSMEHEMYHFKGRIKYNMSDLKACLNPNCREIIDLGESDGKAMIACKSCNMLYCSKRTCEFHPANESCNSRNNPSIIEKMMNYIEAQRLMYTLPNTKRCPNCNLLISNICEDGNPSLKRVQCAECGYRFCWKCMKSVYLLTRYGRPACTCDSGTSFLISAVAGLVVIVATPFLLLWSIPSMIRKKSVRAGFADTVITVNETSCPHALDCNHDTHGANDSDDNE